MITSPSYFPIYDAPTSHSNYNLNSRDFNVQESNESLIFDGSFATASEYSSISNLSSMSNILQVDGMMDTTDKSVANNDVRCGVNIAPYYLDKNKQIGKLADDTTKEDFDITVSPNEHNVNIVCSTGFYSVVALPAFAHLFSGFLVYLDSLVLICYDMNNKVDSSNATVNNVYFFRIENHSKTVLGKVTVHLHHTTRKVQIQGGSLIANKKRAGIWFLENYILGHFRITSKEKAIDISNFNSVVQQLAADHVNKVSNQEKCSDCGIPLINRSNKHVCQACSGIFHKACFEKETHLCNGAGPSGISDCTLSAPLALNLTNSTVNQEAHLNPSDKGEPSYPLTSIYKSLSHLNQPTNTSSPICPQVIAHNEQTRNSTKKPRNQKKSALATTESEIALEVANAEIKTLKVKLKDHDSTIKDLKFQNSVLLERIAAIDIPKKQAIYSSYFSDKEMPSNQTANSVQQCERYHCFSHCHSSCHPINNCMSSPMNLSDISLKLDRILKNLESSNADQPNTNGQASVPVEDKKKSDDSPPNSPLFKENISVNSDSFISIDNYMQDPIEESSLNSKALTNRLNQPMLLT